MQHVKSRKVLCIFGAFCFLACITVWHFSSERNYQGQPLSYWLNRLPPTLIGANNQIQHMGEEVRDKNSGIQFQATSYFNESVAREASRVFESAGPEALPWLLKTLEDNRISQTEVTWKNWLFKLHVVNHRNDFPPSLQRQAQAVTAILLISGHKPPSQMHPYSPPDSLNPERFRTPGKAAPIIPRLVRLAQNRNTQVGISAFFLLGEISTKDYLKLKEGTSHSR